MPWASNQDKEITVGVFHGWTSPGCCCNLVLQSRRWGQREGPCPVLLAPQEYCSINIFGQRAPWAGCEFPDVPKARQTRLGFFFPSLKLKHKREEKSEQRKPENDPVSFSDSNLNSCHWLWKSIFLAPSRFLWPLHKKFHLNSECSCFKFEYTNQNKQKNSTRKVQVSKILVWKQQHNPVKLKCICCYLKITESLGLEETSRTIKSNLWLITALSTKPCCQVPHLLVFWAFPGVVTPPQPWAACVNV